MNSDQHLTYNRQRIHLHPTCYHDQPPSSAPTPSYRSQPLGDPDLFTILLFDRQRAYRRPSSTLIASYSSSPSKVRDTTSATQSLASKHGPVDRTMPPRTRSTNEKQKQKRKVKGKGVTKTLPAKPNTNTAESRVARHSEVATKTISQEEENNAIMVSSNEEEAREVQQLRNELKAANARIKQLEDLLERKVTSRDLRIKQDNLKKVKGEDSMQEEVANKESAPLQVTNNKKPILLTIVPPLLTPQSPPLSAPVVSPCLGGTILNNEDLKFENIRTTYGKVKKKLDTLNVIARKLDWCTKSMDLSNFGEFGVHMKRLSEWLEEDEQQQLQRQQQK